MRTISIQSLQDPYALLKKSIWMYLILLIFEGALRKWLLPGLATPLLIIRDPLALIIIYLAIKNRVIHWNFILVLIVLINIVSLFTTLFMGHGNLWVMLYGLRIYLLHLPLIFIIGNVMNKKDIEQIGFWILVLSIPMVMLILFQFYSPPTAWVNTGIGGEGTAGFDSGTKDFMRPPGTFSFTNGNVMFWGLVQFIIMYFILNQNRIPKVLLYVSSICLIIAIPTSVSRTLFFQQIVAFAFLVLAISNRPKDLQKVIIGAIIFVFFVWGLSQLSFFNKSIDVFLNRFESANKNEGGVEGVLIDRYFGGMIEAIANEKIGDAPIFGQGLGIGSNVGSQLTVGNKTFLISEGEWGRVIGEQGVFLGLILILIRLVLSFNILKQSFIQLSKNNTLPLMLSGYVLLLLPQGQWAQPTALGFAVMVSGLAIAACNTNENNTYKQL